VSGPIRFRLFQPSDRQGLLDLFEAVYAGAARRKTSAWRYLDRSPVRPWISVAEADGRIIGAQPGHEVAVRIEGVVHRGALLLDVMTHPDYRRRGVFAGVVETLRRSCHEHGLHVLLTTPNEAAARGFRRLPAWTPLGEMCPLVCPLDLAGLVSPSMARRGKRDSGPLPVRVSDRLDTPLDGLCEAFATSAPLMIVRDPDFLHWRFSEASGRGYRFFTHDVQGRCDGLAVTAPGALLGRSLLLLVEVMIDEPGGAALDPLLRAVRRQGLEAGASAVLIYLPPHSPLIPFLRRRGFWRVPRILRPRAYTIWLAADPSEPRAGRALDFSGWHMSLADSDLA
jgi:GNAT superfamily N-acetyltransferase